VAAHVSLPQVVPAPRQVPWQLACVVMVQPVVPAELAEQQAPVGAGLQMALGLPSQVVLSPCQTPPVIAWQPASVVIWQGTNGAVEAVRQHAPVVGCGQVESVHTELSPW